MRKRIGFSETVASFGRLAFCTWAVVAASAVPSTLWAQTDEVLAEKRKAEVSTDESTAVEAEADERRPAGFTPRLVLGANFSWVHSNNVVGALDGHSWTLGYVVTAGGDLVSENQRHEWQTGLLWQLGLMRTPAFDEFVKNNDLIDFRTAYLYHLPSIWWVGPFAGFRLSTNMLPGYEVRTDPTTVVRIDSDGNPTPDRLYDGGERIKLTDAFAPTILRETVGVFVLPFTKKKARIDLRASLGAWETLVRDGYALDDDDTTAVLELGQLENSVQVGPQLEASITGVLREGVGYALNAMVMWPFYTSTDNGLEGADLINVEFEALVRVALVSWASLDYSFKAEKLPLIITDWQVQNSILVTISFDFFAETPSPEE